MNAKHILSLYLLLSGLDSFGHDQNVHQAITANATTSAYNNSPAFGDFINVISSDGRLFKDATNSMVDGSFDEDYKDVDKFGNKDAGGKRSLNHFYDPLDMTYYKGLTDVPNDRRSSSPVGNNSFVWGSISNCIGVNYYGVFYTYLFQNNINTKNVWSWPNARYFECKFVGLTSLTK